MKFHRNCFLIRPVGQLLKVFRYGHRNAGCSSYSTSALLQYTPRPTLNGISFNVREGELLMVVGRVGAGKVECDCFMRVIGLLYFFLVSTCT